MTRRHDTVDRQRRMDRFAEIVANTGSLLAARQSLGLTPGEASRVWQNIRKGLGWQAR